MEIIKNEFVDIHYGEDEREQAEELARSYEARGYSREVDNEDFIQLLGTKHEEK